MLRTYSYDKTRYLYRVKVTGYFMLLCIVWFGVKLIMDPGWNIYVLAVIAATYGALNTFVFNSSVKDVVIDDDTITFGAFRKKTYRIDGLRSFQVKEQANDSYFIRLEDENGHKARYWVHFYFFNDKIELANEIYHIEKKINPHQLKFKGREKMFDVRPCYMEKEEDKTAQKPADAGELPEKEGD